jgi:multidrug efflux pump subunit AcrA (membrane-fusion protein)
MYELNVNSRKQLERASLRAQAQKPRIEEIALGMYKVFSTNPATPYNSYSTGIFPAKDGNGYDVVCSCPTQRVVCKHAAAIFPHYLMRLKEQEVAALAAQAEKQAQFEKDYADILEPIYQATAEYTAAQLPPVEVARAQAEQALAALAVITTSTQEIDRLIEQAKEESLDRECPACGLVQPDDDSSDCWCCGAVLNPDDVDPEYTDEQAAFDRACLFG